MLFSARSHRSGEKQSWCLLQEVLVLEGGCNGWAGLNLQNLAVKALRWWKKGKKEGGKETGNVGAG